MNLREKFTIDQIQNLYDYTGELAFQKVYSTLSKSEELPCRIKLRTHAKAIEIEEYLKKFEAEKLSTLIYNTNGDPKNRRSVKVKKEHPISDDNEYTSTVYHFEIENDLFIIQVQTDVDRPTRNIVIDYSVNQQTVAEQIDEWACSFADPIETNKIGFISLQGNHWDMEEVEVTDTPTIDFSLNYNDDFEYDKVTNLVNSGTCGLILLGGAAGSGKTNYLRWLMANSDKKFVYMPANQISLMSSPSFITFALSSLRNCILLMEDCEEALIDRSAMKGGEVQTILNLSDGIIGSALNLTIIGTYNTKDNIDKALFRKGRLLYMYDFTELDTVKANKLSETLGHNIHYTKPQVLSEIYNPESNKVEKVVEAAFGFKIGA